MTEQEYNRLKDFNGTMRDAIRIINPLEKGKVTKVWYKLTQSDGTKGALVGFIFYRLKDIEIVEEE